jgi:uncharacterized repeat protein (TIGR01451 family)
VKYQFIGSNDESLTSINIAQRQHAAGYNSVALLRDTDGLSEVISEAGGFSKRYNPLANEWYDPIVIDGKDARHWDNVHQTIKGTIEEPGVEFNTTPPYVHVKHFGCPECKHSHWRWGAVTELIGNPEGAGQLIGIPKGSHQDLDFAVVTNQSGEEDPLDPFNDLVYGLYQYWQPIRTRNTVGRNPLQIYRDSAPVDVVYWQSGTGDQNSDTFFSYGGFFNPAFINQQLLSGSSSGIATRQNSHRKSNVPSAGTVETEDQDGISSIIASEIYTSGSTSITPFDVSLVEPLPVGYSPYSSVSYDVTSMAEASGPHTITFSVASVLDESVFNSLRVFHLEQDPYDPDAMVWIDRTVLAPDPQAPDFASKTINAKANLLGQFIVASLVDPQPPNTAVADISVSTSDSPDGVVIGANLTYLLNVSNNGPDAATGLVFSNSLPPDMTFVSVTPTQGACSEIEGTVVCKLGAMSIGGNATVTIVVKPKEGGLPLPAQGKTVTASVSAKANETDPNTNNNAVTEDTTILSDGNAAPAVNITSPALASVFVGPAIISLNATASDTDGSVSKVDFYGDGELIGTGTATSPDQYSLVWNNVSFGPHSLIAVATDNLNKTRISDPVTVIVNGSAAVSITSPAWWAGAFNKSANIPITANASLNGGTISKVDFYANEFLIGTGTETGVDQYSITWNNAPSGNYSLIAVATDNSGVTTTSSPIKIIVNDPPIISFLSPANGAAFGAPANITLTANASDGDGSIRQVDFHSSGFPVGTSYALGGNQFNITLSDTAVGSYSYTAVATDNLGNKATSASVSVTVTAPPTVSLTSPANGALFTPPASITLVATASDSDGSIGGVNFYAYGNLIGAGTLTGTNQYSFTWSNVTVGGYFVTARATDNLGVVTSSNSILVTVNSPPSANITSPANGSTFTAPASITINAAADDSNGYVTKVEFFRNSIKIGEDSSFPYSFVWNNVAAGSYSLNAVATDNLGVTGTSTPINITVLPSALFVSGSTTLNSSETALKNRLQTLGYVVTVKDAKLSVSADATGKTVVVVSSTAAANNLGTKFTNITVPVVIWQSASFANMGMTPNGNSNAGTATAQTQVKIILPTHALAGGLTGTQTVVSASSTFGWGKPNANSSKVATLVSDTTKVIIFGYAQGASMPGLVAPARRVGFFMTDTTAVGFNSNGWTLFDAAVNWATASTP